MSCCCSPMTPPGPSGDVFGPASSTPGDVTVFADATGKLIADSGIPSADLVTNAASSTAGHLAGFTDGTGNHIGDTGIAAADVVLGPASAVSGNLPAFSGTSGKVLSDSGESVASLGRLKIVTEAGTTRTLTAADAGAYIRCTNAAGCAITVNTGVFTAGDSVILRQVGAGAITFAGTATLTPPVTNAAISGQQGATVGLVMHTAALGDLSGDLQDV